MLFKRQDKFNVYLANISSNLVEAMNYFNDFKLRDEEGLRGFSEKMKAYETKGDSMVHQVIQDLNKVFITPIEREDILALAMHMDDVLDGLEHTSALFDMYSIYTADHYMEQFVKYIHESVLEIDKAIELLAKKKLLPMREHAIKIKDCESKCDEIRRKSIKDLFQTESDPVKLIKYKEIYEKLEDVADCCEHVANTFEAIIMKNA